MDLSRTAGALRRAIVGQLSAARGDFGAAREALDAAADDGPARPSSSPRSRRPGRRSRSPRATRWPRPCTSPARSAASRTRSTPRRCTRSGCGPRRSSPSASGRGAARRTGRARDAAARAARGARRAARLAGPARARPRRAHPRRRRRPRRALAATRRRAFDALASRIPPPTRACTRPRRRCSPAARRRRRGAARRRPRDRRRARRRPAARRRGRARPPRPPRRCTPARPRVEPDDDGAGLTTRETEVLRLLADGLTNREIAARLFISQKTVGAHMAHIYAKLGVHSRVEAAGRARQLGVVSPTIGWNGSTLGARRAHLSRVPGRSPREESPACHRCSEGTPDDQEGPSMSPSSIGRLCAGAAVTLVLFVVATGSRRPAPRRTRRSRRTPDDRASRMAKIECSPDALPGGRS